MWGPIEKHHFDPAADTSAFLERVRQVLDLPVAPAEKDVSVSPLIAEDWEALQDTRPAGDLLVRVYTAAGAHEWRGAWSDQWLSVWLDALDAMLLVSGIHYASDIGRLNWVRVRHG